MLLSLKLPSPLDVYKRQPLTLTATKDNPNDPAAEYDGQSFSTLSAAVNKAKADNAIDKQDKNIKLLKNIADGISIPSGTVPVSYTHLDVYKRQGPGRPGS